MFVLLKCVLLIVTSLAYRFAVSLPNPAPKRETLVHTGQIIEWSPRGLGYAYQSIFVLASLCHGAVLALLEYSYFQDAHVSASSLFRVCAGNPSPSLPRLASLTPSFVLGTLLVLAGGLLRLRCYAVMQDMFMFEVAIKQDHYLVTSGPYAYIRHPAYASLYAMLAGAYVMHFGANGWIQECRVMHTPARWLVFMWVTLLLLGPVTVFGRMPVEDEALKRRFGVTWEAYAKRVPYRLVPYVL